MNQTISLKTRVYCNEKQSKVFRALTRQYTKACDDVSQFYFKNNMALSKSGLGKLCYYYIRSHYGLKAQPTQSVFRSVLSAYKTVNTLMGEHAYNYQDINTKQWHHCYKDVHWIWHHVHFRRPQVNLLAGRDWSFHPKTHQIMISLLKGTTKVHYGLPSYFRRYLHYPHKLGVAKLLHHSGHWYLHIACTIRLPNYDYHKQTKNTVGIDRGLRFIACTYDDYKHSLFFKGLHARRKRMKFLNQRRQLQSKGTRSAKRKLKHISGRENRWMTDVNHQISKALVRHYTPNTTFVFEDLRGVRFSTEQVPKKYRYVQVSWAFYQLEQFLTYKAHLNYDEVIKINPQYTSQRCPNCGKVLAKSRRHGIHTYICLHCGYTSNDDRIGAMNIRYLGLQKVHGKNNPKIIPNIKDD